MWGRAAFAGLGASCGQRTPAGRWSPNDIGLGVALGQDFSRAPKPATIGPVGLHHFRSREQPLFALRRLAALTLASAVALFPLAGRGQPMVRGEAGGVSYKTELALLHLPLDAAKLRELLVWDPRDTNWRRPQPSERVPSEAAAPVLLVHLWADWCKPCREEFPLLREFAPALEARYRGRVKFVYVAVGTGAAELDGLLAASKGRMPEAPLYLDLSEKGLSAPLRQRSARGELSLPMTLLLDDQRIIRQAFVGSLQNRRAEVAESVERLWQLVTKTAQRP